MTQNKNINLEDLIINFKKELETKIEKVIKLNSVSSISFDNDVFYFRFKVQKESSLLEKFEVFDFDEFENYKLVICAIQVKENYKNKYIGSSLIKSTIDISKKFNFNKIDVDGAYNSDFWEKMNFKKYKLSGFLTSPKYYYYLP